ncbi:MAG: hypothetical protein NUW37_19640 [Planctomycetes bacterium]|nr:hypothetical protein [Planctomycetota bacterium]
MVRNVVAVLVGVLICGILISLIQMISNMLYPLPEELSGLTMEDMGKPETIEKLSAHIDGLPVAAFMIVAASYLIGTFVGSFAATKISGSGSIVGAAIIAVLFIIGGVLNVTAVPHPTWFAVGHFATYPLGAFIGWKLGSKGESTIEPSVAV